MGVQGNHHLCLYVAVSRKTVIAMICVSVDFVCRNLNNHSELALMWNANMQKFQVNQEVTSDFRVIWDKTPWFASLLIDRSKIQLILV